jgi:homoserine O-succinyltransferase
MPLTIERPVPTAPGQAPGERRARPGGFADRSWRTIAIGLVNNMPDAAVAATQRQFVRLIEDASGELDIRLSLFALETVPRAGEARRAMAEDYAPAGAIEAAQLDALVVTGAEPCAADLRDEPFWDELGFVLDWAAENTVSSLLSCLAAHAEVLRSDGVARRPLASKRAGVFSVDVVADHELVRGLGPRYRAPHSRWNDLDEAKLAEKGYRVLARSPECGVDLFVRKARSLLVFLQGHPEYEADTLAREHRRDLMRFLQGEATAPPRPPANYYPPDAAAAVASFARRAMAAPEAAVAAGFPVSALSLKDEPWRQAGVQLVHNWLGLVARRKAARSAATFAVARWGG